MSIISKGVKFARYCYFQLIQKKFKHITYVEKMAASPVLFVGFAGFSNKGNPPRYNYIETLKDLPANQVFFLDNWGYRKAGSYYLGENGQWFMPDEIDELIKTIVEKRHIKKIVTFGTSKGGSAAIYYGLRFHASCIVAGAPQYHIGDYLLAPAHKEILEGIQGHFDLVDQLNDLLPSAIRNGNQETKIIVHYSPNEHTYPEHIVDMVKDMRENGYVVTEDNEYNYCEHGDVGVYFKTLLHKVCKSTIEEVQG